MVGYNKNLLHLATAIVKAIKLCRYNKYTIRKYVLIIRKQNKMYRTLIIYEISFRS